MGDAKIKVFRTSQAIHSGSDYEIYVDGQLAETISDGGEELIEIEPGKHKVLVKSDGNKSQEKTINLKSGSVKKLICGSKLVGWKQWLALEYFLLPISDIYLEEYTPEKRIDYQEETWDELVEKGMVYYVLKEGVIGWGLPVGIFVFISVFIVNLIFSYEQFSMSNIIINLFRTLGIFAIGGLIFGIIMWFLGTRDD